MKQKTSHLHPVYKRVNIWTPKSKETSSDITTPHQGFIRLGNRSRSRSLNRSIKLSHKEPHQNMYSNQKMKTCAGFDENPELDKQNYLPSQAKAKNFRLKTQSRSLSKGKNQITFTFKLFPSQPKCSKELYPQKSKSRSKSKRKIDQCSKLRKRLERVKEYKVIENTFSDMELEGIFNELQLLGIAQVRWALIIIDKAYDVIKHKQGKLKSRQITRQ